MPGPERAWFKVAREVIKTSKCKQASAHTPHTRAHAHTRPWVADLGGHSYPWP